MYSAYSSLRRILTNDYHVSTSIGADSIKVGFRRDIDVFPCITIHRIGGDSYGKLGYQSATGGYRDRSETDLIQVDIFHLDSIEDLELLDDKVITAVMSGAQVGEGFRLISNPSTYDDTYGSYRTTQTWTLNRIEQD